MQPTVAAKRTETAANGSRPERRGPSTRTGSTSQDGRTIIVLDRDGVRKHSLLVAGHRTSVSLETVFWDALRDLADSRGLSVAALVAEIDETRGSANLSSAIRIHLFEARRPPAAQ